MMHDTFLSKNLVWKNIVILLKILIFITWFSIIIHRWILDKQVILIEILDINFSNSVIVNSSHLFSDLL
jgi:hypothetical protein